MTQPRRKSAKNKVSGFRGPPPGFAELSRAERRFLRLAMKYARHVQAQITSGMWDPSRNPTENAFLKAAEDLRL